MTAGGALITSHLVKGPLRISPHPFGARLQAGCAPRAASGLTLDQVKQESLCGDAHAASECRVVYGLALLLCRYVNTYVLLYVITYFRYNTNRKSLSGRVN